MTIHVDVRPLEEVERSPEWLHAVQAAGAPVFYSPPFLAAVASAPLLPTDSASIVLLRDNGSTIAGIPVFQQSRIDPIRHLAPLYSSFPNLQASSGLLGHCWHCYDSRIVAAGCSDEHARALIESFRAHAAALNVDYFGLVNVSDPQTLAAMASAGLTRHYMVDRYVMEIASYASFDDYVAAIHPDSRRELRRQYRRYEESTAALAVESAPFRDLDEAVLLCRRTAARYDAEFYYPDEPTTRLLESLGDAVRLISIRVDGERIGVVVCFFDPPRLHVWAAGMRYDRSAFSPYAIGIAEAIRYAIDSGMTVIEGGRGNGRIKKKQGFVPLPLYACLQRTELHRR